MCLSTFRRSRNINSVHILATDLRSITTSIIFFLPRERGNVLLVRQKRTCWNRSRIFVASARIAQRTLDFADQPWQEILDVRTSTCKMSAIFVRFRRELECVNKFLWTSQLGNFTVILPLAFSQVHSCQQKSIGLKFSKSQTGSDVRYSCHHNSSRFTFPIFAHSCCFFVLHSLQSFTPRIY